MLSTPSPPPTGAVARRMRCSLLTTPYARSLAHARGGSQDEEKFLLLPPFTPRPYQYLGYRYSIILFGIYMSFSRFQYELLVHTPNTDVYRRILECRFTHFAPYVLNIETDVIVRTLPRPHGGRATIHSVSYSQNDIYCSTIIARLPEVAKSQSQG